MMRVWWTAVLLLLPLAGAGTADDPEITDPGNDRELSDAGFAGIEIVKGWVQHTETDLLFFLEMANAASPGSSTQYEWWFDADVGGTALSLGVVGLNGGGYEAAGDATTFEVNGATIVWTVPRADIAPDGTLVSMLSAHADGYGPLGTPPRLATDRAPDSGSGRDYVVTTPAPATPPVAYHNVTDPTLAVVGEFANATSSSAVYNWSGPGNVTLELDVQGNGTVEIAVFDPTGGGQFDCSCQNRSEHLDFVSEPGVWRVNVTCVDFNGTLELNLSATPDGGGGTMTDTGPGGPNGTDEGGGEDSPLPLVLVVVALAVVAARRRS